MFFVDELSRGVLDAIVEPLVNVLFGRLLGVTRDDREAPRMEPLEVEEQSLAREVSGTVFEELQGISLDKSREDITRSFALVGMQRVEARVTG